MFSNTVNHSIRNLVSNGFSATAKCQRLIGKTAIVTASTDGIGFAIAKRLAQEGAKVMISSRKENNVKRAVDQLLGEGLTVAGTICHVGKSDDRKSLLAETKAKFGGIDILVCNAAVNPFFGPIMQCSESAWDKIFEINVKSTFLLMQESLPYLRESKFPSILIVTSIAGYAPFSLLGAYSVSKTALLGLCKATAIELASEGIRVNCLAPGVIKTKFSKMLYESEAANETVLSLVPMGKLGMPEDMGGVAAFLVSEDASYVTGETVVASGGMQSRL